MPQNTQLPTLTRIRQQEQAKEQERRLRLDEARAIVANRLSGPAPDSRTLSDGSFQYDGDTHYKDGVGHRYPSVDTPEVRRRSDGKTEFLAQEAQQRAAELRETEFTHEVSRGQDVHGRQLTEFVNDRGETLSERLVRDGFHVPSRYDSPSTTRAYADFVREFTEGNRPETLQNVNTAGFEVQQAISRQTGDVWNDAVTRGGHQFQGNIGKGIEWIGKVTGADSLENWGAETAHKQFEYALHYPTRVTDISEVDDLADAWLYIVETIGGEAINTTADAALMATGAGVGAVAAKRVAYAGMMKTLLANGPVRPEAIKRAATLQRAKAMNVGAQAALHSSLGVQMIGQTYGQMQAEGIEDPNFMSVAGPAAINTVLQGAAMNQLMGLVRVDRAAALGSATELLKNAGKKIGVTVSAQGAVEGAVQLINELAVKGENPDYDLNALSVWDAAARGAVFGGAASGVSTIGDAAVYGLSSDRRRAASDSSTPDGGVPTITGPHDVGGGSTEFTPESPSDVGQMAEDLVNPDVDRDTMVVHPDNMESVNQVIGSQEGVKTFVAEDGMATVTTRADINQALETNEDRAAALGYETPLDQVGEDAQVVQVLTADGKLRHSEAVRLEDTERAVARLEERFPESKIEVTTPEAEQKRRAEANQGVERINAIRSRLQERAKQQAEVREKNAPDSETPKAQTEASFKQPSQTAQESKPSNQKQPRLATVQLVDDEMGGRERLTNREYDKAIAQRLASAKAGLYSGKQRAKGVSRALDEIRNVAASVTALRGVRIPDQAVSEAKGLSQDVAVALQKAYSDGDQSITPKQIVASAQAVTLLSETLDKSVVVNRLFTERQKQLRAAKKAGDTDAVAEIERRLTVGESLVAELQTALDRIDIGDHQGERKLEVARRRQKESEHLDLDAIYDGLVEALSITDDMTLDSDRITVASDDTSGITPSEVLAADKVGWMLRNDPKKDGRYISFQDGENTTSRYGGDVKPFRLDDDGNFVMSDDESGMVKTVAADDVLSSLNANDRHHEYAITVIDTNKDGVRHAYVSKFPRTKFGVDTALYQYGDIKQTVDVEQFTLDAVKQFMSKGKADKYGRVFPLTSTATGEVIGYINLGNVLQRIEQVTTQLQSKRTGNLSDRYSFALSYLQTSLMRDAEVFGEPTRVVFPREIDNGWVGNYTFGPKGSQVKLISLDVFSHELTKRGLARGDQRTREVVLAKSARQKMAASKSAREYRSELRAARRAGAFNGIAAFDSPQKLRDFSKLSRDEANEYLNELIQGYDNTALTDDSIQVELLYELRGALRFEYRPLVRVTDQGVEQLLYDSVVDTDSDGQKRTIKLSEDRTSRDIPRFYSIKQTKFSTNAAREFIRRHPEGAKVNELRLLAEGDYYLPDDADALLTMAYDSYLAAGDKKKAALIWDFGQIRSSVVSAAYKQLKLDVTSNSKQTAATQRKMLADRWDAILREKRTIHSRDPDELWDKRQFELFKKTGLSSETIGSEVNSQGVLSASEANKIVEQFKTAFKGNLDLQFTVVESQEDALGNKGSVENIGRIKGGYYGDSKRVLLVRNTHKNGADLLETIRHEVLGHHGLDILGAKGKRDILDRIVASKDAPGLKDAWVYVSKKYKDYSEIDQANEVFAHIAELPKSKFLQAVDVVAAVLMKALRSVGLIKGQLSRAEVSRLVASIARGIKRGDFYKDWNTIYQQPQSAQLMFRRGELPRAVLQATRRQVERGLWRSVRDLKKGFMNTVLTADRRLRNISPELADVFYQQSNTIRESNRDGGMFVEVTKNRGEWLNSLNEVMNKLDKSDLKSDLERMQRGENVETPAGRVLRSYLKKFHRYAKTGAKGLGFRQNYFPRVYDVDAIRDNPLVFQNILSQLFPDIDAEATAAKIIDGYNFEESATWKGGPAKGHLNSRNLNHEAFDSMLKDAGFVYDNAQQTLEHYILRTVKRVEFERRFGGLGPLSVITGDRAKITKSLEEQTLGVYGLSIQEAKTQGLVETRDMGGYSVYRVYQPDAKLVNQLAELPADRRAEAKKVIDGYMGRLGADMSPAWRKTNSALVLLQTYLTLLFSTVASLPELAGPIVRAKSFSDLGRIVRVYVNTARNYAEKLERSKTIGYVNRRLTNQAFLEQFGVNHLSGFAQKGMESFFKWNGQQLWTDMTRVMSGAVAEDFLINHAQKAVQGDENSTRYLRELNIDAETVLQWEADGQPTWSPNSDNDISNRRASEVQRSIAQFVDESILRPNAAMRPVWASDPRFMLVWHLKSFFYAFGKVILGGVFREAQTRVKSGQIAAAAVPLLLMGMFMLPLAALGLSIREWIQYGDSGKPTDRMQEGEYLMELVKRSGFYGPLEMAFSALNAEQYGSNAVVALLGPAFQHAEVLATGSTEQKISRSLPIVNQIPQLRRELGL